MICIPHFEFDLSFTDVEVCTMKCTVAYGFISVFGILRLVHGSEAQLEVQ